MEAARRSFFGHDRLVPGGGRTRAHLLERFQAGATEAFNSVGTAIERLHTEGTPWVREFATIGVLEGIPECLEPSSGKPRRILSVPRPGIAAPVARGSTGSGQGRRPMWPSKGKPFAAADVMPLNTFPPGWKPVHVGVEGDSVSLHGLKPWKLKWQSISQEPIIVPHPSHHHERHQAWVYEIESSGKRARFAAGDSPTESGVFLCSRLAHPLRYAA